ncbi:carboxyesterase 20 [Perilla frutescens var. hirtella]|uniref:Carboxyesterase 20 n=1 Tax=Perilla frutescens var. hirtella TaxID=608512 RepID=A0AAD4JMK7_PERFH|nr:carboxyesterase 20 [Perilla frutescens var. hirtella]
MPFADATATDPYTYLGFIQNADSSITRVPDFLPATAASADPSNPVLTKDIPINQQTGTWARLYLPTLAPASTKLPVILYYHGSGFVVSSAATSLFQKFCSDIVLEIPAVMVSVEYRLAPEHRLPAAYDDGHEALHWLKASDDEWLIKYADLSKCYLMGSSAGGNIVYHVALREAACGGGGLAPVKIRGLILHHPFFGGVERSSSEIRLVNDKGLPPSLTDVMWELALPVGADRDHGYCNPMKSVRVELVKKMKSEGWKFLVTGCDGDPLIDRQLEFAKVMRENGVEVIQDFSEGGCHGVEIADDSKATFLYGLIKNFLLTS